MRKLTLSMVAVFALFGAGQVQAQTANPTARVNIPQVLYIDVDNVDFGTVGATEFNAGSASTTADVRHRGNVLHDVNMKADGTDLVGTADATNKIPVSDMSWTAGALSGAVGTADALVVDDAAAGANTTTMDFDIALDYATNDPDEYTVGVTFTVVAS